MERSDLSRVRRGLARAAARARLAGVMITAAALLVVPIVLWATFGDGQLQHAVAVAIIATLLCWYFIHRLDGGHASGVAPAAQQSHHDRSQAGARRLDPQRPARAPRLARDVGCAAAGQLEGRAVRRRHG
ncbi:MAG: hypothetical protein WKF48_08990 [Solirubrobacteraceae bacterium]